MQRRKQREPQVGTEKQNQEREVSGEVKEDRTREFTGKTPGVAVGGDRKSVV